MGVATTLADDLCRLLGAAEQLSTEKKVKDQLSLAIEKAEALEAILSTEEDARRNFFRDPLP